MEPLLDNRWQAVELLADHDGVRTWRGRDTTTGASVAIKALNVHAVPNATVLELFERQAAVLRNLRHPGIPAFCASFDTQLQDVPHKVLVTAWVEGQNLEQWVRDGASPTQNELLDLGIQAAHILEDLHARVPPVVHRDVKPQNLLRDPAGALHLVDFGSVKIPSSSAAASRGATMVGTFGYMAPEQYTGVAAPTADVHALGMTLLYLVTHTHPHQFGEGGPRKAMEQLEAVSPAFRDALLQLTHPDPARRPRDGAAARALLEAARDGNPAAAATSSSRGWILAGAAMALLLMAGQGAYFFYAARQPTVRVVNVPPSPPPRDGPQPPTPPQPPPKEDRGFLVMPIWLGAAERCFIRAVPRVLQARWRYTSWTNLEAGPDCKERYISYGVYSAYDDAPGICEDAVERAPENVKPAVRGVAKASATAVPLLRKADRYYDDARYKDDNCAGAKALHRELVDAFAAMVAAGAALEDVLAREETRALKEAADSHQEAGRTVERDAVRLVAAYQKLAAKAPRWPKDPYDVQALAKEAQAVLDQAQPLEDLTHAGKPLGAGTSELVTTVVNGVGSLRSITRGAREGRVHTETGLAFDPLKMRVPFHDMMTNLYLWAETRW